MMASIHVLNMRNLMAKTTLTITVKTKYERQMKMRAHVGSILLKLVAWVIGVKMIELDWD